MEQRYIGLETEFKQNISENAEYYLFSFIYLSTNKNIFYQRIKINVRFTISQSNY